MRRRKYPEDYEPEEWDEMCERFADPGGDSCLYPATEDNPRNLPCGNCGEPNRLTRMDKYQGYQCNTCADQAERGY
jgi:hypothetical protein